MAFSRFIAAALANRPITILGDGLHGITIKTDNPYGAERVKESIEQFIEPPIYALVARPEIGSYADLRGRTIVVDSPNGITTWLLRRMLGAQGLGPDDYNLVYVGDTPGRLQAQLAGGVQASMLLQPFDFAGERQGQRRLGNSNEVVRNYEFAGYNVRRDWLARNEDTVARYIRAYVDTSLRRVPGIRYTLDSTFVGTDSVVLLYTVHLPDGSDKTGTDLMRVDRNGKIVEWRCHYHSFTPDDTDHLMVD